MKHSTLPLLVLVGPLCFLIALEPAAAAITWSGDVTPTDPLNWTSSTRSCVGDYGVGTLTVDSANKLYSKYNHIGFHTDSIGTVTIDGGGSTWDNGDFMFVGRYGNGTLTIRDGAAVTVGGTTYVASEVGAVGTICLDDGILTSDSLCASPTDLAGTGTILTRGLVTDIPIVFDSAESLYQTFTFNSASEQNITLNVDLTNPSSVRHLGAGWKGNGSLAIENGLQLTSREAYIGYHPGSTGLATVDGGNTVWTNGASACAFYVGYYGSGTLNITGGGTVVNNDYYGEIGREAGSTGVVTVAGAGSRWINNNVYGLLVGRYGNGVLEIIDGGTVEVDGSTWLGMLPGSTGTIHLDNGGTLTTESLGASPTQLTGSGTINTSGLISDVDLVLDSAASFQQTFIFNSLPDQNIVVVMDMQNTGDLGAGWQGHGSLAIRSGTRVWCDFGRIGQCPGSTGTVTVSGTGSKWTTRESLLVGFGGSGSLTIEDGGDVENAPNATIGSLAGAEGQVTVGRDATWTSGGYIIVGRSGHGTLEIAGDGVVASSSGIIGYETGSVGAATLSGAGAKWTSTQTFCVGEWGNGTLEITDGGVVSGGRYYSGIGLRTGSIGAATVSGAGSTWTNGGHLFVGQAGSGTLSISSGGLVGVAETLIIDYNEDGDSFINMSTGGMLALCGQADGALSDFLDLIVGTDTIRYWDDSAGDWAPITAATPGVDYRLAYIDGAISDLYGYTLLIVGVSSEIPGDANLDGVVDDEDASIVGAHWMQSGTWRDGDFNLDTVVNDKDAAILAAHWGEGVGEESVPEPGSLALLSGVAVMGLIHLRRRNV